MNKAIWGQSKRNYGFRVADDDDGDDNDVNDDDEEDNYNGRGSDTADGVFAQMANDDG